MDQTFESSMTSPRSQLGASILNNSFRNSRIAGLNPSTEQGRYIPSSYGQQYRGYHKNTYNKPFTQQKGEYLFDEYEKSERMKTDSIKEDYYSKHPMETISQQDHNNLTKSFVSLPNNSFFKNINDQTVNQSHYSSSFFPNNSFVSQGPGNTTSRSMRTNILTEHAMNNPSVFNTIAKENLFTNISYQANKDYDFTYNPIDGFVIRIDCMEVSFPATLIKSLKLSYEVLDADSQESIWIEDADTLKYEDIYKQAQNVNYRKNIKNILCMNSIHIILRAKYEIQDIPNRIVQEFDTFSIIPLFKNGGLNTGRHQLKFLQTNGKYHPIQHLQGFSFPAVFNVNCYIRLCRPQSLLDQQRNMNNQVGYKEDNTTLRTEREELEGFWQKKQRLQDEKLYRESQEYAKKYPPKRKMDKMDRYNIANLSYDLVQPSRYANFTTHIPRKPIKAKIERGQFRIDRYV